MKVKEGMKTVYALNSEGQRKLSQYVAECAFIEAVMTLESAADNGTVPCLRVGGEVVIFGAEDFEPIEVLA